MGRNIGIVLLAAAGIALVLIAVLMFSPDSGRTLSASILGFVLFSAVFVLIPGGLGAYFLMQGRQESAQMAQVAQQRKLLGLIRAQGQVDISDVAIEMNTPVERIKSDLYDLVSKGLYSGYINWDKGVLYSAEASNLRQLTQCRNCGGQLDLAGKGVVRCPYCGTEYFL